MNRERHVTFSHHVRDDHGYHLLPGASAVGYVAAAIGGVLYLMLEVWECMHKSGRSAELTVNLTA